MTKCCGNCIWWEKKEAHAKGDIGNCKDAAERARRVIPFAVNLRETSMVFAHGGKDCPCFEPKVDA